jgi:hypothetical protein
VRQTYFARDAIRPSVTEQRLKTVGRFTRVKTGVRPVTEDYTRHGRGGVKQYL